MTDESLEQGLARVDDALEAGDTARAEQALGPLERAHARDARVLTARARVLAQQGDLQGARTLLEDVVNTHPMLGIPSAYLGQVLAGLEQWQLARPRLEKALQLGVDKPSVRHALGTVMFRLERHADAVTHLLKAKAGEPDNADILVTLAAAQDASGHPLDAEATLRELKDKGHDLPNAYVMLANFQRDLGKLSDAIKTIEDAAKKFPGELALVRAKASLLAADGRHGDVVKLIKGIPEKDRNAEDWCFLSSVALQENHPQDAVTYARKAVALDVKYWRSHQALGLALEAAEPSNGNAIMDAYENAIALGDPEGLAGTRLGLLLMTVPDERNTREAIDILEQARERGGNHPATLWHLALAYARARDTAHVKAICDALLRADIDPAMKQQAQDLLAELPKLK